MESRQIIQQAAALQPELQAIRRDLHRHPELGFELHYTKALVREKLEAMGYAPQECGKCGLVALAGGKQPGKTILIRGDMDALPIPEQAEIDYKSETAGKMHGCGHDMHTAMMLGAAKLLKEHEEEIRGTVKLMFQPAEEIFQGSQDMIDAGVLEDPKVDAALMIHVVPGLPMPAGMMLVQGGGVSMASCEQYHILVKGRGGHGSMPSACIDPSTAAAQIHLAMQEINSRELDPHAYGVFTTCRFEAGKTSNVIPDSAEMWGTIRTVDPEGKIGGQIKTRMAEIAKGIGSAMRCEVEVEFYDFCPCMVIDPALSADTLRYMTELIGPGALDMGKLSGGKAGGGSEDFAFVSHKVPTVGMLLSTGNAKEGYCYTQHNPKAKFDDSVLFRGSAAYVYAAARWLEEHK